MSAAQRLFTSSIRGGFEGMAQRAKTKDLVIFIPGILGSRLTLGGKPFWGDDSPTFLQWARRHAGEVGRLGIGPDDASLDDLGDGIAAEGLIERPLVVGRFLRIAGYAALLRFLQKDLGLKLGENLQVFAYDWRRDLRVASRRLVTKVEGWLRAWQGRCGNRDAKAILVAHAMGGLVARHYADVEGGWPSIRRIVTIGTPFLGSIRSLDLLYFGLDFQKYGLPLHDLTPVVRTLTSLYELLPFYPAIRTFSGATLSPFEVRIPTFEHQKIERARQFHRTLIDHHEKNRTHASYASMTSTVIVGIGQPTVEFAQLLANGTLSVDPDPTRSGPDGDGTVPRFSAEASAPWGFEARLFYLPQTHSMLPADPVTHAHLDRSIAERRPGETAVAPPLPRFTLRRTQGNQLRVESDSLALLVSQPFYRLGASVELRACVRTATGDPLESRTLRVAARVEQVAAVGKRARPTSVRLRPESGRPGWFSARFRPAAPGTYRVMAITNAKSLSPFRVADFFEVDAK